MCGLVGYITNSNSEKNNLQILESMSASLSHRGPDSHGSISYINKIYLAHRRLSILDLGSGGEQPMYSNSERYIISFNGEIYNHLSLRLVLEKYKSIKWKSTSDTETLIEFFDYFGIEETLSKISGMFSISLLDKKEKKLILIRDRMGEKPMYYGFNNNIFFFGSELKAFKANQDIQLSLNKHSISKYFKYGYIPAPFSIFQDVYKLQPAHYLIISFDNFNASKYEIKKYWRKKNEKNIEKDYSKIKNKAKNLLFDSVKEQLISDVPLGAFLSSGIDSSLIVSMMQEITPGNVNTFSIGFEEKEYDESKNAKKIASFLKTNHNEFYVDTKNVQDMIPYISEIYDEPFSDSSQVPTYLVSKFAKQKVKVSLSGDGGDELFGGYNRYVNSSKILQFNKLIPKYIKNILINFLQILSPNSWNKLLYFLMNFYILPKINLPGDKIYKLIGLIEKNNISDLYDFYISHWNKNDQPFSDNINNIYLEEKYEFINFNDFSQEMMHYDSITYLPDDILVKVDRAAMANSLETRAPFLNHDLVSYAHNIPSSFKLGKKNKIILRDILNTYLPKELFDLPKAGFGMPIDLWLKNDLKDWAISLVNKKDIESQGILNRNKIISIFDQHFKGQRNWNNKIWTVLMFQSWLINNV